MSALRLPLTESQVLVMRRSRVRIPKAAPQVRAGPDVSGPAFLLPAWHVS